MNFAQVKLLIVVMFFFTTACSTAPYALIDGGRSIKNDDNNFNVYIVSIDGKHNLPNRTRQVLEPGTYRLEFSSARPQVSRGRQELKELVLEAKACMKYVITAQHESNLSLVDPDWELMILEEREIEDCK
ncbi:hypothetical protein [Aurantivibrio infirmus]